MPIHLLWIVRYKHIPNDIEGKNCIKKWKKNEKKQGKWKTNEGKKIWKYKNEKKKMNREIIKKHFK